MMLVMGKYGTLYNNSAAKKISKHLQKRDLGVRCLKKLLMLVLFLKLLQILPFNRGKPQCT